MFLWNSATRNPLAQEDRFYLNFDLSDYTVFEEKYHDAAFTKEHSSTFSCISKSNISRDYLQRFAVSGLECFSTKGGLDYVGTIGRTKSGYKCQRWTSNFVSRHL